MDQNAAQPPIHVLIFPLPLQGPVNSMLNLAELLCLADLHVTFLVTDHIHARLHRHSNIQTRFSPYPGFRIRSIPDGLPVNHPRVDGFLDLFNSLRHNTKPLFKEMLSSDPTRPVTCVIADGILGFTCDVANELGLPIFYVRTISAACLWLFFSLPNLIQSGELPFQGNDLDVAVKSVPGMENYLRRRDLPSFCRSADFSNDPNVEMYKTERDEIPRARGLILNTFEDLEGPILRETRAVCPNIYSVGPLHAHLKSKRGSNTWNSNSNSSCLWEEDRSCLAWLDSQTKGSVVYVSFGSLATTTPDQLVEFWHGLMNSGHRFLWVVRPPGQENIPEVGRERGYVVGWAPQEEVLGHEAVGGFLTHGGWNSTLESVWEGVPMICWPQFVDQQVNSRMVEAVWGVGLDVKDTCDRGVIERAVVSVMGTRKGEFAGRAEEMAGRARRCVSEGGSSYCDLERLVADIKSSSAAGDRVV